MGETSYIKIVTVSRSVRPMVFRIVKGDALFGILSGEDQLSEMQQSVFKHPVSLYQKSWDFLGESHALLGELSGSLQLRSDHVVGPEAGDDQEDSRAFSQPLTQFSGASVALFHLGSSIAFDGH